MTLRRWIAIAAVVLFVGAMPLMAQIFLPGSVTPPPVPPANMGTLTGTLAKKTGLTDKQVDAVLRELGPTVAERLADGQGFELQGIGSFRVIRIPAHRVLTGYYQAAAVPARNSVEFVPAANFDTTLNLPGAVAGVPVGEPIPHVIPNRVPSLRVQPLNDPILDPVPNRVPSLKVGRTRVP